LLPERERPFVVLLMGERDAPYVPMSSVSLPQLTDSLYDQLLAYVGRRLPNQADAEDLVQQVLLKVIARDPPRDELFAPWLFRVARNAVVDAYRAQSRSRRETADGVRELTTAVEASTDTGAIADYLVQLIAALQAEDRDALVAVELNGQGQKQFAADQQLSYSAAKSRVQRARKRLRRELEAHCELRLDARGVPVSCTPRRSSCCD
jgi:RNA polymerase sigma-70 factor, ECF subfamily